MAYLSGVDKGVEGSFFCYAFDIYIRENNGRVIATTVDVQMMFLTKAKFYRSEDLQLKSDSLQSFGRTLHHQLPCVC